MTASYKRIVQLVDLWPINKTRVGKNLGTHLREQVENRLVAGKTEGIQEEFDRIYLSLKRISEDYYMKKYPRTKSSTATGLTAEQCKLVLTSEFQELLEKGNPTVTQKLIAFITRKQNDKNVSKPHTPVMVQEVVNNFKPESNQIFLDMTFGAGGHTKKILESASNIKILALDRDPVAYKFAQELSKEYPNQVVPLLGRFSELPKLLSEKGIKYNSLDGILFDFGCSSMQFDTDERGFSVSKDGPLDMRMDGSRFPNQPTAADVLSFSDEEDIARILKVYGEEKQAKKIARAIIETRYMFKDIRTTSELADLINSVLYEEVRRDKLNRPTHNATKTFQALRIFVNNEVNEINYGMILAQKYLKLGGKIITITFHSIEDTIVKRHLYGNIIEDAANPISLKYSNHTLCYSKETVEEIMDSNWMCLTKHVITPKYDEVEENPRSRSAKLRVAIRIK